MDDAARLRELEKLLRESNARAEEERRRAEASEEQTRPTTLNEYIAACHSLVYTNFAAQRDRRLTSRGSITNPRPKWCPTNLKPWFGFIDRQRTVFGALYESFPSDRQVFENRSFLAGLGQRIGRRAIGDEKTLEYFLHNGVEDPVRAIIDELNNVEAIEKVFRIEDGVIFENHPHAISEAAKEVVQQETPSTPPSTPGHHLDLNQLRPDQICVYRSNETSSMRRTMLYVSEYKPPHKLTAPHLRLGLRSMDIYKRWSTGKRYRHPWIRKASSNIMQRS